MTRKTLSVNIRGDDDLGLRGQLRLIGEADGWEVEEATAFDESKGKMLTRQVYSQDFDDPETGETALNKLAGSINEFSGIAVVICPGVVLP
jgi:hypothetical protein